LSSRHKRIVVASGLIALVVSTGIAIRGPDRALQDAKRLLHRAGTSWAKPSAANDAGPATRQLRALLKMSPDAPAIDSNVHGDDGSACGLEQLRAALNGEEKAATLLEQSKAVLSEVALRMSKSLIEQERAMGLFAQIGVAEFVGNEPDWDEVKTCLEDDACIEKKSAERQQAIGIYIAALAQMAYQTKDPSVYATAFYTCRNSSETPECKNISAERWADIDRNNAVPLLFLASEVSRSQSSVNRDQALLEASNSILFEPRMLPVLSLAQADAVQSASPSQRFLINSLLAGQFIGYSVIDYSALFSICKPPANSHSGRQETCSKIAEKLAQQDNTLVGLNMARIVGMWTGWPADRVANLKDEGDAAMHVAHTAFGFGEPVTCSGAAQLQNYFNDIARLGELTALRQRIAATGKSASSLAEMYRQSSQKTASEETTKKAAK